MIKTVDDLIEAEYKFIQSVPTLAYKFNKDDQWLIIYKKIEQTNKFSLLYRGDSKEMKEFLVEVGGECYL